MRPAHPYPDNVTLSSLMPARDLQFLRSAGRQLQIPR